MSQQDKRASGLTVAELFILLGFVIIFVVYATTLLWNSKAPTPYPAHADKLQQKELEHKR